MSTELTTVWMENRETKELVRWKCYPYGTFMFSRTEFAAYIDDKNLDIFINHQGILRDTYWHHIDDGWIRCNWNCHIPKIIQMHILTGAL